MKQVLAIRVGAKKAVGHIVSKKWWPTVVDSLSLCSWTVAPRCSGFLLGGDSLISLFFLGSTWKLGFLSFCLPLTRFDVGIPSGEVDLLLADLAPRYSGFLARMSLSPRYSGSQLIGTTLTLTTLLWFRTGEVVAYTVLFWCSCCHWQWWLAVIWCYSGFILLCWFELAACFSLEVSSVVVWTRKWSHGSLSLLVVSVFLMTAVVPSFLKASLSRTMLVISHLVIYGSNLQGFAFTDLHGICRHYKKAAR